jgi:hypothetical protein
VRFREDILRGVRLFAIVFAVILVCVAAYRMLRTPSDVQGAAPDDSATAEAAKPSPQPSPDAVPASETASEGHPLVVPAPPPVGGAPVVTRTAHPKTRGDSDVPPPPPVAAAVRSRKAAPSGREFESSDTVALPVAPLEESAEAKPLAPKQAVGYKSLIEANANRPPVDAVTLPPSDDSSEKPAKGNRFFKAVGKIFRPGSKKETTPLALDPKPQ